MYKFNIIIAIIFCLLSLYSPDSIYDVAGYGFIRSLLHILLFSFLIFKKTNNRLIASGSFLCTGGMFALCIIMLQSLSDFIIPNSLSGSLLITVLIRDRIFLMLTWFIIVFYCMMAVKNTTKPAIRQQLFNSVKIAIILLIISQSLLINSSDVAMIARILVFVGTAMVCIGLYKDYKKS